MLHEYKSIVDGLIFECDSYCTNQDKESDVFCCSVVVDMKIEYFEKQRMT